MAHNRVADALSRMPCRVLRSSRLTQRQGWRFQVVLSMLRNNRIQHLQLHRVWGGMPF